MTDPRFSFDRMASFSRLSAGGVHLGRIAGIPITLRYSFFFLLLFALIYTGGLAGVLLLLVTFASVLVHEMGHALVARRLDVRIVGIDLHFFGGAAKMADPPKSPRDEILIAAAGPAVSACLALLSGGMFLLTHHVAPLYLALVNALLAVFNLLPALPMDGGRILRAVLCRRYGRLRATEIAVKVARVVAIGIGVFGLVRGSFFLVGLAVMLWILGSAELRAAQLWQMFASSGPFSPFFGAGASSSAGPAHPGPAPASGPPTVEVLDKDGRPISTEPVFSRDSNIATGDRRHAPADAAGRQFVVRMPDGRVVVASERVLRW